MINTKQSRLDDFRGCIMDCRNWQHMQPIDPTALIVWYQCTYHKKQGFRSDGL